MKPLKRLLSVRRVTCILFIFAIIFSVQIGRVNATISFWIAKEKMLIPRGQSVVLVEDELIYVIGGVDRTNGMALASMEIYDPMTNSWITGAPLPNAAAGAAGAKGLDGILYVISGAGLGQNSVQAYNPTTNTWTLKTNIPKSVWAADAATGEDGNIYVIGGLGGSDLVQVYNPTSDTWSFGSTMPTPRLGLGVIKGEDGLIYAIGGYSLDEQKALSTVEMYNPVTNTWTTKTALPSPLCQFGIILGPLGKIYVLGGSANYVNNTGPFYQTVYSFSTSTNIWENEDPMPTSRGELGGATVGNRIFAIGGANGNLYLDTNEVAIVHDDIDPTADAGLDEEVGQGELTYFNGSRSTDNIGIANYTWMFTDVTPQILTGVNPTYIFETVEVYNVMLNVTDWGGNWDTDNVTITVNDTELPIADAYINKLRIPSESGLITYRVEPGTAITYDASDSSDNVDSIENLQFEWTFGDGTSSEDMRISYTHIPPLPTAYTYVVTLKVIDSAGNIGIEEINIIFLEKEESIISFTANPINIALGNAISVSGSLISVSGSLSITKENVTIIYTTPQISGGEKLSRETGLNSYGFFNDTFITFAVGSWSVKVYWEGNVTYKSSTSTEMIFTVSKTSSFISCELSALTVNEDESITVSGRITPNIHGAIIILNYSKPEGTVRINRVETDSEGDYSDIIDSDEKGVWEVTASWEGDETMEGAISSEVSFTVIGAFRFPSETLVSSILIVLFLLSLYFSKSINFYFSKLKKKL